MRKLAALVIIHFATPEGPHVLLGKHKNRGWTIAGGKNEGEPILETAYREAEEETGAKLGKYLKFFTLHEWEDWLCVVYEYYSPDFLPVGIGEPIFEKWDVFPLNDLPAPMYESTRVLLEKFKEAYKCSDGPTSQ